MSQKPILQLQNVSFAIRENRVENQLFHSVNLDVNEGDRLGILGASGSGKSMMAALATHSLPKSLDFISEGEISVYQNENGHSYSSTKTKQLRAVIAQQIGMVFQEPTTILNPLLTCGYHVVENMQKHLLLSKNEAAEQTLSLFSEVGIEDPNRIFNAYPHQVSGGQLQRVVLALAVSHQPKLIIADEATSSLDASTQQKVLDYLLRLNEEKRTALWVITHDEKVLSYLNCKSFKLSEKKLIDSSPTKKEATHLDQNAFGDEMVLEVQNLGFSYPKSDNGFNEVSFNLHEGEILGIAGQSGSGKSTLAKALVKVFSATGSISPNYPIGRVQLIFQSPDAALDPLQRVGKGIMEVVRIHHKLSKNDRRAKALELMQQVGLDESYFNRLPHQLSSGQKQRICIAKALACQPKVLICDECVSSLDADIKHEILSLLQTLSITQNVGIVFITHDIGLIKGFAHNVLVMANGQVVESGNALQVLNEPETDATKALLAALL